MTKRNQIITRCFAMLMLFGIVLLQCYEIYISFKNLDKPVNIVTKVDSIPQSFDINGYDFYIRNDTFYDVRDCMYTDLSINDKSTNTSENASDPNLLKDVIIEVFGGKNEEIEDYSVFGCGKADIQRRYIMSVINSMRAGRTIEISRWVTSGDWRDDNYEMTVTIP